MKSMKRTVDLLDLTLWQLMALEGYRDQQELLAAVRNTGHDVPQPQLSAMLRGSREYPKARRAVAAVLLRRVSAADRDAVLLRLIGNAKAAQDVRDARARARA